MEGYDSDRVALSLSSGVSPTSPEQPAKVPPAESPKLDEVEMTPAEPQLPSSHPDLNPLAGASLSDFDMKAGCEAVPATRGGQKGMVLLHKALSTAEKKRAAATAAEAAATAAEAAAAIAAAPKKRGRKQGPPPATAPAAPVIKKPAAAATASSSTDFSRDIVVEGVRYRVKWQVQAKRAGIVTFKKVGGSQIFMISEEMANTKSNAIAIAIKMCDEMELGVLGVDPEALRKRRSEILAMNDR